ncbi:GAF domain-containing hybrid sensor histidine kinase/response regulator [Methylophaga thiooxydans]|uniref:histidine kinase n=1 Tax=Methylophaga thiooxydans DMS010 TaxID=637616 RepID=C0N9I3_9GAMM|nr:ATP-binding protein [Methylophaga thiooxydans]EEF78526.1 ATPase, histidine kinase-, DNA gyrase B-, and HSP90-like domain protein [Methylophaga thiooxydans DMS010]
MDAPKIPTDEAERIKALLSADILDTQNEPMFDNLTTLVADVFDVPIVAISLVDETRQWFKSIHGLDVCETSREVSFCGHVVHQKVPMVVEDARQDTRFFDNPLVQDGPEIVFYAGVPVFYKHRGEKYPIGTLCLIDYNPRDFDQTALRRLKAFAHEIELILDMRRTTEKAEAANDAKTTFLANMTHELRTPMSGIIGILDILGQSTLDKAQLNQVSLASKSANQMLSVINDILDFSKIDADKVTVNHEAFNLYEVFSSVIETFALHQQSQKKKFILNCQWDKTLNVNGDPMRLRQVLFNLLSNADKFTTNGEVAVTAKVFDIDAENIRINCDVSDTGIGIEQDQLERLFIPFEQLDNASSRKYGGTGLGLVISQRLCELMGGSISVESKLGHGSTFRFFITLQKTSVVSDEECDEVTSIENKKSTLSQLSVLLAEDDLTNRFTLEYFLTHLDISFDSALNGREALEKLSHNQNDKRYDVILMDCQMPEKDGFETSRQIRTEHHLSPYKQVPIIALTANALEGDREKCLQAGMTDYMTKPVDINTLIDKLYKWGVSNI